MEPQVSPISLYLKLKARMEVKIAKSEGAENLLPPPDFDFRVYFDAIIPIDMKPPETSNRKRYQDQWQNLLYATRGQPTILALNMLLISYLRRETPHTEPARFLFFRLWNEFSFELLDIISTRDLISTLRTFADHSPEEHIRLSAKCAFLYAHFIKLYESERKAEGGKLWRAGYKVPGGCPKIGIPDTWGVLLGGDNSFEILNVLLAEEIERSEIIGPMILTLLSRVQSGKTVFSRYDRARIGSDYQCNSERDWSFGFNPQKYHDILI